MNYLNHLYPAGSVNARRVDTDALFIDEKAVSRFTGRLDETIRFIEDFQLLDPEQWARFVEQFRVRTDSEDGGWRGEYWGKMMRGASFTYSYTKNPALYKALSDTVEDMMTAMDELGRISSYSTDNEFSGWDVWCRKYILLGMQYFLEICTDQSLTGRVIDSMKTQADYLIAHLGREEGKTSLTEATNYWRGLASSSVLEPIVRLYDLTNEQKYLDFAFYIVSEGGTSIENIFELAYEDKTDPYQYPITKAYEMISCFEGILELYRATGIEKYRDTVERFARRLMNTDITIIGSAGCTHELLDHAAARQTDTAYQGIMQETCVTVTWMKFCMQMLALTGQASFAEAFENSLYNAYLGAVNTEKNVDVKLIRQRFPEATLQPLPFDSYSSLLPNTRGRGIGGLKLMSDGHYYGCCACIGAAGIGMMHKVALMASSDGWAANLFIPGTIDTFSPAGQKVRFTCETAYPADGTVTFTISLDRPEDADFAIRIPSWSHKVIMTVNGCDYFTRPKYGYEHLHRVWADGDTVTVTFDMRTRVLRPQSNPRDIIITKTAWKFGYMVPRVVEETPEAKFHVALLRGPLVLARDARLDGTIDEAVDVAVDENGYAIIEKASKPDVKNSVCFTVKQNNGRAFTVIDYASAGKTWDEKSKYACWLPTKEYWR